MLALRLGQDSQTMPSSSDVIGPTMVNFLSRVSQGHKESELLAGDFMQIGTARSQQPNIGSPTTHCSIARILWLSWNRAPVSPSGKKLGSKGPLQNRSFGHYFKRCGSCVSSRINDGAYPSKRPPGHVRTGQYTLMIHDRQCNIVRIQHCSSATSANRSMSDSHTTPHLAMFSAVWERGSSVGPQVLRGNQARHGA